ncbi:hypothetical protein [Rhodococcus wratislaviensis]|uniref:Uncharacterized protein n=1 Tax=Rhodococcus wratislaviensis NBRC 100605 TaxID=1219028 RepID=X0Q0F1_RHOWR|nr:hypothetical protein [Rhodococcus wratislaviensis]GAF44307.1 hypothetical protein RW1_012_01260 [Rhodococcus wratislaviensis NBRC 100605]
MPARGASMIERVVQVLESFKGASGPLTGVGDSAEDRDPDAVGASAYALEAVARSSSALTLREVALPYMEDLRSSCGPRQVPHVRAVLDASDGRTWSTR